MTRRMLTRVLLSLLLLVSQQMALAHAVSHWSALLGTSSQLHQGQAQEQAQQQVRADVAKAHQDGTLAATFAQDQICHQCLAFAQIAGVLGSNARTFVVPDPASPALAARTIPAHGRRSAPPFQPRAPPPVI